MTLMLKRLSAPRESTSNFRFSRWEQFRRLNYRYPAITLLFLTMTVMTVALLSS